MTYQKKFRVRVAHDQNDSHDDAVVPDLLWKRFLLGVTTSTDGSKDFYMFKTHLTYLERHGFLSAFFYYGREGTSTKGDAGNWGKSGSLKPENVEGWRDVSCAMDDTACNGVRGGPLTCRPRQRSESSGW